MEPDQILNAVYSRHTKSLFKSFLILLEDLNHDHQSNFDKLRDAIPEEYHDLLNQADHFDKRKLQYLRKKILDLGNESIRTAENSFENFTISFKF